MTTKNQAMATNRLRFPGTHSDIYVYELISTDAFNKEPYTEIAGKNLGYPPVGAIIKQNGLKWTEFLPYEEHSFEYATIYGIDNDRMQVYGNKIGLQIIDKHLTTNNNLDKPIFEFHRGDKLLLEIDKRIHIVHNISQAKLIYEMQQLCPKIRY